MKCIKLTISSDTDHKKRVNIYRVSELTAKILVDGGHAKFVSKSVWKKYGRKFDEGCEKQALESFRAMKKNTEKGAI